jgi:hypothetical protein
MCCYLRVARYLLSKWHCIWDEGWGDLSMIPEVTWRSRVRRNPEESMQWGRKEKKGKGMWGT